MITNQELYQYLSDENYVGFNLDSIHSNIVNFNQFCGICEVEITRMIPGDNVCTKYEITQEALAILKTYANGEVMIYNSSTKTFKINYEIPFIDILTEIKVLARKEKLQSLLT